MRRLRTTTIRGRRGLATLLIAALFAATVSVIPATAGASVALDGSPVTIASEPSNSTERFHNGRLAYNSVDDNFLAVFQFGSTTPFLTMSQVVSKSGTPVGSPRTIHDPADRCAGCTDRTLGPRSLVYNSGANEFVLVWSEIATECADREQADEGERICGQRLDTSGSPIGAAVELMKHDGCLLRDPSLTANPERSEYVVVATARGACDIGVTSSRPEILIRRLSENLAGLGSTAIVSDTTDASAFTEEASVTYNPVVDQYLATWRQPASGGILGARRIGATGSPVGDVIELASGVALRSSVAVAADGSYGLVTSPGGAGAATFHRLSSSAAPMETTTGLAALEREGRDYLSVLVALNGGGWALESRKVHQFAASGAPDGPAILAGSWLEDLAVANDGTVLVLSTGGSFRSVETVVLVSLGPGGFTDVPAGAFYAEAVGWLKAEGITTGTSATTYSPDDIVTRGQMAAFLHRLVGEPGGSPTHGFSDVSAGAFYNAAVAWLKAEGITTGTSATTYSPDDPVTRGQMAAFLHRLAGEPAGSPAHGFSDVPAGAFFADAVGWLKAEGITTGTGPGTYSPNDPVTRGQMAAFLFRMATDSDWIRPT